MPSPNPMKAKLLAGDVAIGALVTTPSPAAAAAMAAAGLDWLMIDGEHGAIGLESIASMVQATAGSACAPLVRVPGIDATACKPVLDAGAFGIVFPMVSSAGQARIAAAATKYPPRGVRGYGPWTAPARWALSEADYLAQADDALVTIALLEHAEALPHLDAIVAVDGIDVFLIAPNDLAASLGHLGDAGHPDVGAAIATIEQAVLAAGRTLGGRAGTPDEIARGRERGYRVLVIGTESSLLHEGIAPYLR